MTSTRTLGLFAAALVGIHAAAVTLWTSGLVEWWHIGILDLDNEESIGTWFSSLILLYAGRLLLKRAEGVDRVRWMVLAVGFHFLSLDEVAGFHEYLNSVVTEVSWAVLAIPLVGAIGVYMIPLLKRIERAEAVQFVVAGAVYVGGAVGVELATEPFIDADGLNTLAYNLTTALEEGMEMGGVLLFIRALRGR